MAVTTVLSFALEVPDIAEGVRFYTDASLVANVEEDIARLPCAGQDHDSIVLLGGARAKRLHHIALRVDTLNRMANEIACRGQGRCCA